MSLISVSVKHGRTLDEARTRLQMAVNEVQTRFGPMVQKVDWSNDRNRVKMTGVGFVVEMRLDALDVHVTGDLPFLSNLLASPVVSGLKEIVSRTFQKQPPGEGAGAIPK